MSNEIKPITEAPAEIKKIIKKVIDHEKRNLNNKGRGIKEDIVDIIKKEIQ